jgi:hypothetical protein
VTLPFDLYPWFALLSSIAILIMFSAHTWRMAINRRRFHDDRAAVDLLVALTLLVASVGLLISALASFAGGVGADIVTRQEMRNAGLGIVRGVLVATAIVMVVTDRRSGSRV